MCLIVLCLFLLILPLIYILLYCFRKFNFYHDGLHENCVGIQSLDCAIS